MTAKEKRCTDCAECVRKNKILCCNDLWGQECETIDECPLGIELEEINSITEKAEAVKVDHGTGKTVKTERKPKITKVSEEKKQLFGEITELLTTKYGGNAKIEIENKLIIVQIAQKTFKIDLIEQRSKKK